VQSLEVKEKFIELRAVGYSYDKISKELGVSKQALIDWARDLQDEIINRKSLELEALYDKFYLLKEHRIKTFGELLSKIKDEIHKRDFSEIPTDKLMDLLLKYDIQVKEELTEPIFKTTDEIKQDKEDRALIEEFTKSSI
jgi:predicted transcriptional regulator